MNNTDIDTNIKMACARGEILNAVQKMAGLGLTTSDIDGILSGVLADLRLQQKMELLNEHIELNRQQQQKIDELQNKLAKAKEAAKKVLSAGKENEDGRTKRDN